MDLTKVSAPLLAVSHCFDAVTFAKSIAVIEDDEATVKARRAAKEETLRHVRRHQDIVAGDPVLDLVATAIIGALDEVESNLAA